MSKETSMANSSSRIYYRGASGSVPFMWESQPGTPKHQFSDTALPPLTPPPSYQSNSNSKSKTLHKETNKPKLLNAIFPSRFTKKNHASPNSSSSWSCASSSSSSSSSSWSSSRSTNSKFQRRYFSCSSRTRIHYNMDDGHGHSHGSPISTLCFGGTKAKSFNGGPGCYSLVNMKNAFFSIAGSHGSNKQGTA
ncbi:hypothetical protein Patl1_06748 [Pistacia atlantica]|uniref:Uncharacterized protein n=1 Tax=Pistacia atlantica TaxID=434234 RepID=A0ACC1BQ12_9ROSI|nr:hypothetical protein Patl1_06748 [Pistacia atlantica]